MARKDPNALPSDAELEILKVLWSQGPSTVKAIHTAVEGGRSAARVSTTTSKLLEIMLGKGLVTRDDSTWPHTYTAKARRESVLRRYVSKTLSTVFDKSASQFMLRALESGSVKPEEIADIKAMLEAYEKEQRHE